MSLRKITSLTTLLSFLLLILTSTILYITPQGKIAFWANWNYWGIGKEEWSALHTNLGLLFLIAGIIHTLLNWKPIVNYLRNKAKKIKVFTVDFNIALILTLVVAGMTLFSLPPIRLIQTFNHALKKAAAEKYGEPPYGHAEASSLHSFCKRTGLNLKTSIAVLEDNGLESISDEATLAEIARANDMTPQEVYLLIKPETPKMKATKPMPEKPRMGLGRRALAGVCAEYGLDPEETLNELRGYGIKATAEASMKEIAEKNDMNVPALYAVIRQLQN